MKQEIDAHELGKRIAEEVIRKLDEKDPVITKMFNDIFIDPDAKDEPEKRCYSCKHSSGDNVCNTCGEYNNWQPKDPVCPTCGKGKE